MKKLSPRQKQNAKEVIAGLVADSKERALRREALHACMHEARASLK